MRHSRGKGEGEGVEVEGDGPMVRKDAQNKVCTSKGMRDRRIRLSPNTAIQFYDVQDRLGYDRPSKAIDWLMKEARVAIDALYAHHHGHRQEYRLPATTTMFNPSQAAFHRTPCDDYETNLNHDHNYPIALMNLINTCQTEGENPVIVPQEINLFSDFTWNPNYNTGGEGFASSVRREPLQSSFLHPNAHTSNNEFANDNGSLGSSLQQEIQVQDPCTQTLPSL